MPDRIRQGEGALPPVLNSLLRRGEGYGWIEGCGVTLTNNSTDIEAQVSAGSVRVNGDVVSVASTTELIPDGDAQHPRKDLVAVDHNGTVDVLTGDPREVTPDGRAREFTWSPAPADAATYDGVLLAEVWVPTGAASNDDLNPNLDVFDRRVKDVGGLGLIPERSSDPVEQDLVHARIWLNTAANSGAGEWRLYNPAADSIQALSTTTVTSFSGTTTRLIEDFDDSIDANWRGGESSYDYTTPAFEGANSAHWNDQGRTVDYSLPGDGLPYYADSGDTVAIAIRGDSGVSEMDLGFAKSADSNFKDYRVRANFAVDELQLVRVDEFDNPQVLGSTSLNLAETTWYIIEADYDGGGTGIHPCRIWSTDTTTDPGTRDTQLAEVAAPTADETYRGRGYLIRIDGNGRFDYLHVDSP